MGKHSNIILCDDQNKIIDGIKHISGLVSSVREVLPGRDYFIPQIQNKWNPLRFSAQYTDMEISDAGSCIFIKSKEDSDVLNYVNLSEHMKEKPMAVYKALYSCYTGLSPIMAQEICCRAGVDGDMPANVLNDDKLHALYNVLCTMMTQIVTGAFHPVIVYDEKTPIEFASLPLTLYSDKTVKSFDSISTLLEQYYAQRSTLTRIRQKSVDLRKIVQTALERNVKKYDLQMKQMQDTEKRDKYKVYGELLNTYGYNVEKGAKSIDALN